MRSSSIILRKTSFHKIPVSFARNLVEWSIVDQQLEYVLSLLSVNPFFSYLALRRRSESAKGNIVAIELEDYYLNWHCVHFFGNSLTLVRCLYYLLYLKSTHFLHQHIDCNFSTSKVQGPF